jgi:hypothetical protein
MKGQTHFGMPRGAKMSLALNKTKIGCSSFKFKHLPPRMHHKWQEFIAFACKQPMGNHGGSTLNEEFY